MTKQLSTKLSIFVTQYRIIYVFSCRFLVSKRNIRDTTTDVALSRVVKYLKENDIFAVSYDEGNELCVLKRQIYYKKLQEYLSCQQFKKARLALIV